MTTSTTDVITDPQRRHEFVLLFDVTNGNPNGDPDSGGDPRVDTETMHGIVSDVAIKRKIRDFVDLDRTDDSRYKIYIARDQYLVETRKRVFAEHAKTDNAPDPQTAAQWMCEQFFDVRMFGAVMSMSEAKAGQVRGPLQFTSARSVDPIAPVEQTLARVALERPSEGDDSEDGPGHGTFGHRSIVPYGLYVAHGYWLPYLAQRTGADGEDLALLWRALTMMWDLDRSAARGDLACQGLVVFSHENQLGNAPAAPLLRRVRPSLRDGVTVPRSIDDYEIAVDEDDLPSGVAVTHIEVG